jgi:hypothetical protein
MSNAFTSGSRQKMYAGEYMPYAEMGGMYSDPFSNMGGGYSMFGSYNSMPDYTGGYMPNFGQQLPPQFGYSQPTGFASQFGGGMGGGFNAPQMQQPNVNDLFGQYMFGQYYGMPAFNPFQQTSMFGGGSRRGGGRGQLGNVIRQAVSSIGNRLDGSRQQSSPFDDLELDVDALRAALGLSGTSQGGASAAQITPSGDMPRGSSAPAATPSPSSAMPQTPFDLTAFNQLTQGNLPQAPAAPSPSSPSPPQIPPNLNLFVPGFSGPEAGIGSAQPAPPFAQMGPASPAPAPPPPPPPPPIMTGGAREYTQPIEQTFTAMSQPVAPQLQSGGGLPYIEPPQMFAPQVPQQIPSMPQQPALQRALQTPQSFGALGQIPREELIAMLGGFR